MMRVTRKQTLSPSFFWYDTDFTEFDSAGIIDYILKSQCHAKRRMGAAIFWYDNSKDLKVCFLASYISKKIIRVYTAFFSFYIPTLELILLTSAICVVYGCIQGSEYWTLKSPYNFILILPEYSFPFTALNSYPFAQQSVLQCSQKVSFRPKIGP